MKPIQIGKIAYTNILPIYYFFETDNLNTCLVSKVPTSLNKGMAEGTIDIGPISSFAYGKNYSKFVLIPDLSVSAMGPVGSIFLFLKGKSLNDLNNQSTIALTNNSASSVCLLKIILQKFRMIKPNYITMEPDLKKMMEIADAALLIGDDALKAYFTNQSFNLVDLGEEWFIHTGLSMTFAVWAVRREITESRSKEIYHIYLNFMKAKAKGKRFRNEVISQAIRELGGSTTFWENYYQGLSYDLNGNELVGLETFYNLAYEIGLLSNKIHIETLKF